MSPVPLDSPSRYLTIQFLRWLEERPRSYGDVMEAWRTSCPRLSIWEDARLDNLVQLEDGRGRDRRVVVTAAGRDLLRDATRLGESEQCRIDREG